MTWINEKHPTIDYQCKYRYEKNFTVCMKLTYELSSDRIIRMLHFWGDRPLNTITTVPFIDANIYNNNVSSDSYEHRSILSILGNNQNTSKSSRLRDNTTIVANTEENENINVWVYVPKSNVPPDTSHPILQSYVDIIVRGCLYISGEEFARSFISTTTGWTQSSNRIQSPSHWVNDRDFPMYKRADRVYSVLNGAKIDYLLFDEIQSSEVDHCTGNNATTVTHRVIYDPLLHIKQLTEHLERDVDTVHPNAFQHIISRIQTYESLKKRKTPIRN
jgi:hypothetical protein